MDEVRRLGTDVAEVDWRDVVTRIIKYLIEGVVVMAVSYSLLSNKGKRAGFNEVMMLGLVAAACFAVLDLLSPSYGSSARSALGMSVGFNLGGFPRTA